VHHTSVQGKLPVQNRKTDETVYLASDNKFPKGIEAIVNRIECQLSELISDKGGSNNRKFINWIKLSTKNTILMLL
jgi:hypothetical protein